MKLDGNNLYQCLLIKALFLWKVGIMQVQGEAIRIIQSSCLAVIPNSCTLLLLLTMPVHELNDSLKTAVKPKDGHFIEFAV